MQLGLFIKTHRTRRRLTQAELASLAGITQGSLSLIEKGETKSLSGATLVGLATALGVEPKLLAVASDGEIESDLPVAHDEAIAVIAKALSPQSQALLRVIAEAMHNYESQLPKPRRPSKRPATG